MPNRTFEEVVGSPEFLALEADYAARLPGWHQTERDRVDQTTIRSAIKTMPPAKLLGAVLRLIQVLEFYFRRALAVRLRAHRPGKGVRPDAFLFAADKAVRGKLYGGGSRDEVQNWWCLVDEQQDCAMRVSVVLDLMMARFRERLVKVPRGEPLVRGVILGDAKAFDASVQGMMASKKLRNMRHPFDASGGKDDLAGCVRLAIAEMYDKAPPVCALRDKRLAGLGFDTGTLDVLIRAGQFANGAGAQMLAASDKEFGFVLMGLTGLLGKLPVRAQSRLVDDIRKLVKLQKPALQKADGDSKPLQKEVGTSEPPRAVVEFVEDITDLESLSTVDDQSDAFDYERAREILKQRNPRLHELVRGVSADGKSTITAVKEAAGVSREAVYKWIRPIQKAWRQDQEVAPGVSSAYRREPER